MRRKQQWRTKSAKMFEVLTFATTTLGDTFPTYNASSEAKRMKRSSPFYLAIKNEQERAEFLKAGIDLPKGKIIGGGEFVRFDIAEDDPQFESFASVLRKRVIDDSSAHATRESVRVPVQPKPLGDGNSEWLDGYSGQTVEELLALEGKYRIASLVLAFEQAIQQKEGRSDSLSLAEEERVVLAVEALEREVNNGGYSQFFVNSSEFAPTIVEALQRIGCKKIATITQRAIKALGVSEVTTKIIDSAVATEDERRLIKLSYCDDAYYNSPESIAERLFAFIRTNKASIRL